jgi:hypothetical protein
MTPDSVDDLRTRLRDLGYLTHGVERWFALDPWSSRTFWQELLLVAAKSGALVAPFAALPMIAAMIVRNRPVTLATGATLAAAYLVFAFVLVGALVTLTALALKARAARTIDHPGLLTAIALALSIALSLGIAVWWSGFAELPGALEGIVVALLVLLLVAAGTVVFSAAILSFSVREARQIPAVARSSRSLPILVAGAAMILLALAATRIGTPEPRRERPRQIVAAQTGSRVALLAVDGLTRQLYLARPRLRDSFVADAAVAFTPSASAAERWATAGTGTRREVHQVRSVESLRLPAADRVLQQVSRFDPLATGAARRSGLVRRQPLPSAIRERDYVWEILASRGLPVLAVNWWVSAASDAGPLRVVPQEAIFSGAAGKDPAAGAAEIDARALAALAGAIDDRSVRLATAYLPSLDILLNRLEIGQERRLALSLRALDRIAAAVGDLRARGFDVILIGSPSEGGEGGGVIAATFPLARREASAADLAPTLLDLAGFPASREMAGASLLERSTQARIDSFGSRSAPVSAEPADRTEYHEALRSLGYVR